MTKYDIISIRILYFCRIVILLEKKIRNKDYRQIESLYSEANSIMKFLLSEIEYVKSNFEDKILQDLFLYSDSYKEILIKLDSYFFHDDDSEY